MFVRTLKRTVDRLVSSVQKRFLLPVVCTVTFFIWLSLCHAHYDSYWQGTIYRVQTVDFNMLHHTLPATLSYLVLTGRDESVQKVLDSTYGIFGLVVTDPSGNEILYKTKAVYKREHWQKMVSVDYLKQIKEPYDLLTDPPPGSSTHVHVTPRMTDTKDLSDQPQGRVLGRVYYLRGLPPTFAEDLLGAVFSNWMEMSGSKRGYVVLTMAVLGFATSFVLLVLFRQRSLELKQKELKSRESELAIRRKALEQLNADIASQRQRKEWLESESEMAYRRALALNESLQRLKEMFFAVDMRPGAPGQAAAPTSAQAAPAGPVHVRPPLHPASSLIEEIEGLLPDLANNAKILRSQAEVLQSYCSQLELRQSEMQQVLKMREATISEQVRQAQANAGQNMMGGPPASGASNSVHQAVPPQVNVHPDPVIRSVRQDRR